MADEELPPLKICSKCGKAKPATSDYFRCRGSDGLRASGPCRTCLADYSKRWYDSHRDYVSKRDKARYAADPKLFSERAKRWREKNSEAIKRKNAEDYRSKPDKRLANDRWRTANPERYRASIKAWESRHPEKMKAIARAREARRRSRKRKAGGNHTVHDIAAMTKAQKNRCWWCGGRLEIFEVDHRIPLSRGGSNGPENLVLACKPCNRSKNAKMPWEMDNPRLL